MQSTPPAGPDGMRPAIVTQSALREELSRLGLDALETEVLEETGSTNADLAECAAAGRAGHGSVVIARHQAQARGRLDRTWTTEPDSSILMSLLVDPRALAGPRAAFGGASPSAPETAYPALSTTPQSLTSRLGLLPLAVGAGAVEAVRELTGVQACLKWPNDILVGEKKLAGILCQLVPLSMDRPALSGGVQTGELDSSGAQPGGFGVVVGLGMNVRQERGELPVETATSLLLEGQQDVDGNRLAALMVERILRHAAEVLATGDLSPAASVMTTLGARVRVERVAHDPSQDDIGEAVDLADDGGLVVRRDDGSYVTVQAGDVWHIRPESSRRTDPSAAGGAA